MLEYHNFFECWKALGLEDGLLLEDGPQVCLLLEDGAPPALAVTRDFFQTAPSSAFSPVPVSEDKFPQDCHGRLPVAVTKFKERVRKVSDFFTAFEGELEQARRTLAQVEPVVKSAGVFPVEPKRTVIRKDNPGLLG